MLRKRYLNLGLLFLLFFRFFWTFAVVEDEEKESKSSKIFRSVYKHRWKILVNSVIIFVLALVWRNKNKDRYYRRMINKIKKQNYLNEAIKTVLEEIKEFANSDTVGQGVFEADELQIQQQSAFSSPQQLRFINDELPNISKLAQPDNNTNFEKLQSIINNYNNFIIDLNKSKILIKILKSKRPVQSTYCQNTIDDCFFDTFFKKAREVETLIVIYRMQYLKKYLGSTLPDVGELLVFHKKEEKESLFQKAKNKINLIFTKSREDSRNRENVL